MVSVQHGIQQSGTKSSGQPEDSQRHWADRQYSPIEAAFAVAQFTSFNAAFFLQQCDLAGLQLTTDGRLVLFRSHETEMNDRQRFLDLWLRLDRSGRTGRAVRTSLKRRGLVETPADAAQAA